MVPTMVAPPWSCVDGLSEAVSGMSEPRDSLDGAVV